MVGVVKDRASARQKYGKAAHAALLVLIVRSVSSQGKEQYGNTENEGYTYCYEGQSRVYAE